MKVLVILLSLIGVGCQPVSADDLDDGLSCGLRIYADTQPDAGSWAQQIFRELAQDTDHEQPVSLTTIKYWMIANERKDGDPNRPERMGTLSHALQSCLTPLPDRQVLTGEVLAKAEAILLVINPPPPVIDPASLIAYHQRRESLALFRKRADVAAQIIEREFADKSPKRRVEIYQDVVAILRDEVDRI